MKKLIIRGYYGMNYVTIKNIPTKKTRHGHVIAMDMNTIEKMVAVKLIEERIPLRGIEVKFIRKTLGLSLAAFGAELGLTPTAVMKWEKEPEKRLVLTNEVSVRAFFAGRLGVKLAGTLSILKGLDETPKEIFLMAS